MEEKLLYYKNLLKHAGRKLQFKEIKGLAMNSESFKMQQKKYPYFQYIESCNELACKDVEKWIFYPGMTFKNRKKWWPDKGERPTEHEGLDICYFRNRSGSTLQFDPTTRIPVMTSGTVLGICKDFLGRSVFLRHEGDDMVSVYAHIVPVAHITRGSAVSGGEIIGTVADTTGRKNKMPPHVHLTIMKIQEKLSVDYLDWNFICNSGKVTLFDPLSLIFCPSCEIL